MCWWLQIKLFLFSHTFSSTLNIFSQKGKHRVQFAFYLTLILLCNLHLPDTCSVGLRRVRTLTRSRTPKKRRPLWKVKWVWLFRWSPLTLTLRADHAGESFVEHTYVLLELVEAPLTSSCTGKVASQLLYIGSDCWWGRGSIRPTAEVKARVGWVSGVLTAYPDRKLCAVQTIVPTFFRPACPPRPLYCALLGIEVLWCGYLWPVSKMNPIRDDRGDRQYPQG